jgi:hypothetical protein
LLSPLSTINTALEIDHLSHHPLSCHTHKML